VTVGGLGVDEIVRTHGLTGKLGELGAYVARQRWSGGRDRKVQRVDVDDAALLAAGVPTLIFTVTRVTYDDGREVRYLLPLGLRPLGDVLAERAPDFMIGTTARDGDDLLLYDALGDPAYVHWLWNAIRAQRDLSTAQARLRFECADPAALEPTDAPAVRPLGVEQSNTSLQLGEAAFLKHLRRVLPGPAHELEMADALERAGFHSFARILGVAYYDAETEAPTPIALLQPYLHNATEGWALALTSLRDLYAVAEEASVRDAAGRRSIVDEQASAFVGEAARLGTVIAEMHLALTSPGLGDAFQPKAITASQLKAWAEAMTADLDSLLARSEPAIAPLRPIRDALATRFAAIRELQPSGLCIRIHGDLHLGQTLRTDSGWIVLDFEGEPDRSPEQRRQRSTPIQDVAGMLRSLDYAAAVALAERLVPDSSEYEELMAYGDVWSAENRDAFWAAYLETVGRHPLLLEPGALTLLRAFEVHKAVYEVGYELRHRPGWVGIPLRFLLRGAPEPP
jgi:maltokinase